LLGHRPLMWRDSGNMWRDSGNMWRDSGRHVEGFGALCGGIRGVMWN
jgi:hypothetical protein